MTSLLILARSPSLDYLENVSPSPYTPPPQMLITRSRGQVEQFYGLSEEDVLWMTCILLKLYIDKYLCHESILDGMLMFCDRSGLGRKKSFNPVQLKSKHYITRYILSSLSFEWLSPKNLQQINPLRRRSLAFDRNFRLQSLNFLKPNLPRTWTHTIHTPPVLFGLPFSRNGGPNSRTRACVHLLLK
jgi:hypothetical protein